MRLGPYWILKTADEQEIKLYMYIPGTLTELSIVLSAVLMAVASSEELHATSVFRI